MEEIWKDIIGFEGHYQVSNLGRLKSLERLVIYSNSRKTIYPEKILKPRKHKNGYVVIGLNKNCNKKYFRVHRLVAEAFIANLENKPQVNHINGKKDDNRVDNLEWNTHSENSQHAFDTGLNKQYKGEENNQSKLSNQQILEIRASYKTQNELSKIYNVSQTLINYIKRRKVWKHI